jgi:hypothetical protein
VPGVSGTPLTYVPFITSGTGNLKLCNYGAATVTTTASVSMSVGVYQ